MGRGIFLLGLLALAAKLAVATSFSPVSWMVTAMCAWLAVGTARGWSAALRTPPPQPLRIPPAGVR